MHDIHLDFCQKKLKWHNLAHRLFDPWSISLGKNSKQARRAVTEAEIQGYYHTWIIMENTTDQREPRSRGERLPARLTVEITLSGCTKCQCSLQLMYTRGAHLLFPRTAYTPPQSSLEWRDFLLSSASTLEGALLFTFRFFFERNSLPPGVEKFLYCRSDAWPPAWRSANALGECKVNAKKWDIIAKRCQIIKRASVHQALVQGSVRC